MNVGESNLSSPYGRSIESLGLDLLTLIAENIWGAHYVYSPKLHQCRLVSRTFNQTIIPLAYRHLNLGPKLIQTVESPHNQIALEHISQHTRHFWITRGVDGDKLAFLLSRCRNVKSISWSLNSGPIPKAVEDVIRHKLPLCQLHLRNYHLRKSRHENIISPLLPRSNIISLHATDLLCDLPAGIQPLQELAAASPNLQSLFLFIRTARLFTPVPRLPPVEELTIHCDPNWNNCGQAVDYVWDLSRLRALVLATPDPWLFSSVLSSVGSSPKLESLRLLINSSRRLDPIVTSMLREVLSRTLNLRCLELRLRPMSLSLATLSVAWKNLTKLKVHDQPGFANDSQPCSALSSTDLAKLQQHCTLLEDLGFDLATGTSHFESFDNIAHFLRLKYLTVHLQTKLNEHDDNDETTDIDYEAAKILVDRLVVQKQGLSVISVKFEVGGYLTQNWRVSSSWALQREKGFIPERHIDFRLSPQRMALIHTASLQLYGRNIKRYSDHNVTEVFTNYYGEQNWNQHGTYRH